MQDRSKRINKKEKGQLMVELMVAGGLLIVGMLGVFAVLSQSLGLSRVVANQYIAANLAAEGIEIVKNTIDTSYLQYGYWNYYIPNNLTNDYGVQYNKLDFNEDWASDVLKYSEDGTYGYDSGKETGFRRKINIQVSGDGNTMTVISTVSWIDRGGMDFNIVLEDQFKNWRGL
jgi:hypothetical protein